MDRQAIYDKIVEVLATEFEIERAKLVPEANLVDDLDLDSIDAIDLVVRLQREIGVKVTADDFNGIHTLDDVVNVIVRLVARQEK